MSGFHWADTRGADGAPLQMTLRGRLAGHLPALLPELRRDLSLSFDRRFESLTEVKGLRQGALFPTILDAVARYNALALFGEEFCRLYDVPEDPGLVRYGVHMIEHTLLIAEVLRMLPAFSRDLIGKFMSARLNSGTVMTEALLQIVTKRFEERELHRAGQDTPEHHDCIQWIMDHSPRHKPWTAMRVVHELIAVWFGSVHIASTTACAALFDLCDHPEYVPVLRQEIETTGWKAFDKAGGQIFPLMDSFLEGNQSARKVLKPFQFSDGTEARAGQWICSAPKAMNRNPDTWAKANEFYGFRFAKPEILEQALSSHETLVSPSSHEEKF
ncbi:Uu.00g123870.m01.CDS01 [Anthostomella pinea]|uniref:Uu.00g123870.m01.CDS01 n=1 Tax=Anthostomella pinea TaxID=933095 RepID=A0AAI8YF49_9PEZI|nr:Uu.00g123870.m01.CDS01 [Anthostomella pinea]